jgi:hypothetical protein
VREENGETDRDEWTPTNGGGSWGGRLTEVSRKGGKGQSGGQGQTDVKKMWGRKIGEPRIGANERECRRRVLMPDGRKRGTIASQRGLAVTPFLACHGLRRDTRGNGHSYGDETEFSDHRDIESIPLQQDHVGFLEDQGILTLWNPSLN